MLTAEAKTRAHTHNKMRSKNTRSPAHTCSRALTKANTLLLWHAHETPPVHVSPPWQLILHWFGFVTYSTDVQPACARVRCCASTVTAAAPTTAAGHAPPRRSATAGRGQGTHSVGGSTTPAADLRRSTSCTRRATRRLRRRTIDEQCRISTPHNRSRIPRPRTHSESASSHSQRTSRSPKASAELGAPPAQCTRRTPE